MTNKWDNEAIEYSDVDKLRAALVGRSVEAVHSRELGTYYGTVDLVLDNGDILTAYEADGGCACSNGCFNLQPQLARTSTILGVDVIEYEQIFDYETSNYVSRPVAAGKASEDGEAIIRLFIYTELGKQELLTSEGGDNGYYGWGYHLALKTNKKENN